jgi:hypothetical protein
METKEKVTHTPTPWKTISHGYNKAGHLHLEIVNKQKTSICELFGDKQNPLWTDEQINNAEFIVRAVNSHEALLNAAKEALCWIDPDCKYDGIKITEDSSEREKMIIELQDAIAQAERP